MKEFTELEKIIIMNALTKYAECNKEEIAKSCESLKSKLMPILSNMTKAEFDETSKLFEEKYPLGD